MSSLNIASAFAAELRQAARRLSRSPGFAALAIGTLGIGIGINAAMFALMDALLFRPPFHVAEPADVVRVQFPLEDPAEPVVLDRTHYPNFIALRDSGAFEAVAAYTAREVSVGYGRDASLVTAMLVSREFFDVLRPAPHLGHFIPGESTIPDGGDRAIVSFGFWQRRFGGDSRIVGTTITIDGKIYSVAGVTPNGFQSLNPRPIEIWLPLDHATSGLGHSGWREDRERLWLEIVGRVPQGASPGVAEARATAMLRHRRTTPLDDDDDPVVRAATTSIVPGRGANKTLESKVSLWLAGVSAFVLLIACANVSNLVLARMFAQRRELFIRLTLGASRRDLVRRSLADTCAIVIPGAAGALAMSYLLRNGISGFLSGDLPLSRNLWDLRSAGIMTGSALLSFVLVFAVSLSQLRSAITDTGLLARATTPGNPGKGSRRTLLAVQAGLCLALLFVAGLFATSLGRVESMDLGVELDRTIQLTINLPPGRRSPAEMRTIYERAREVLASHPDVERATLAQASPFMSGSGAGPRTAERSFADLWTNREAAYRSAVDAGFFTTVGSQSLRGRDFNESDRAGAQAVAIINAPLARHLWPDKDALGECMWLDDSPACIRVVGVLGGVWKFSALKRDKMALYVPLAQVPAASPGALFIRPRGDARTFLAQVRSIVQAMHPDLPAVRAVIARDIVDPEFRPWRLGATVFSAFAAVALLIASIGLYGVVAVSTAMRLKEIGIRMALGAGWTHVIRVVVAEGVTSVACGLFAGTILAAVASRWLSGVLFETSPGDSAVLIQTALILLTVSAAAVTVPVIRALGTNPAKVLRSE